MSVLSNSILLSIADFNILLWTKEKNIKLSIDNIYRNFLATKNKSSIQKFNSTTLDINIEILRQDLSKFFLYHEHLVFKGNDDTNNNLWEIYSINNKYYIKFNISNKYTPVLSFNLNDFHWELIINENSFLNQSEAFNPLIYPIGIMLLYYIINLNNGFILHASGIQYENYGYIFSGLSGVGKSTIAHLWQEQGATIINDDRLIIKKHDNQFFMYNTPLYKNDIPKKSTITKLFLLKQSNRNFIRGIDNLSTKTSKIIPYCIQHNYNSLLIENLINIVADFSKNISICELEFVPNSSVISLILHNELQNF